MIFISYSKSRLRNWKKTSISWSVQVLPSICPSFACRKRQRNLRIACAIKTGHSASASSCHGFQSGDCSICILAAEPRDRYTTWLSACQADETEINLQETETTNPACIPRPNQCDLSANSWYLTCWADADRSFTRRICVWREACPAHTIG